MAAIALKPRSPIQRARSKLLSESGVPPEQAAIVGDSHTDIETGHNAGLWTVGVTYGFAPQTLMDAHPDVLVDTPAEVGAVFSGTVEK